MPADARQAADAAAARGADPTEQHREHRIMIVGTMCMSHSPLMDRNRADPGAEQRFGEALSRAERLVEQAQPDLTIVFYPDHINGFFYKLLPSFCVGAAGTSIGDFGTVQGALDIPEAAAFSLTRSLLDQGIDTAVSLDMEVDHGAMQPLELLSARHSLSRIIPVFINCAAAPRPTFERVRALGRAVGDWAQALPERVLMIGSGGLSHDPPIPSLTTAPQPVREQLIAGRPLNHSQRLARQNRAINEGYALAAGTSEILPLNPEWDEKLMTAFTAGDLTVLDDMSDETLSATGGRGGHEVRAWVAALAALGPDYRAERLFYEPIDEWITGMGILHASRAA